MAWIYLVAAGIFEIGLAASLKYSDGFTRPGPAAATAACVVASMWFLGLAARDLPIGTAYAVWTGIGVIGSTVLGMIVFGEACNASRIACIGLIVAGVSGLRLFAPE